MVELLNEFYNLFYSLIVGITGDVATNAIYSEFATLCSYIVLAIMVFTVCAVPFAVLIKLINFVCGGYK